jgi:hypothetical protein
MPKPSFTKASELSNRVDAYFNYIEGVYHIEIKSIKETKDRSNMEQKIWDREPEPPTIAGLAIFLGFNSRQAFDDYERKGRFKHILKRGRLHIEAVYEKKLHNQSPAGAIFALKAMGWNEKSESKTPKNEDFKSLKIEIIETGPKLAENEKEGVL